jgi:acetyl esterase/lipase
MISKEAQKSIKKYKKYAAFISAFYKTPSEMTSWRIGFFRWFINLQGVIGPKAEGTIKEEVSLGGIRTLKVSTPNSDPERVFLYYHGGGYAMGSPESHYSLVSYLADISQTTIYVPDYRLGPESKYPAQLEDGLKTYESLINDFGYSSNQIAIGGDSAGGNLALITLLKLKQLGVELPSSVALLSPWADPSGSGDTYTQDMADRDILLGPIMKNVWQNNDELYHYYIDEKDVEKENEHMFPLNGDYKNCPPIMIQVGTEELLLSDSQSLKKILERDGCVHEYFEWKGMYHVFHIDVNMPETIEAFKQIGYFLEKYLPKKTEMES